ncbi:MAG: molybdate ABC transporter substrate-binding protein [Planctomycetes bacterium]|nr:molybdate ABC transporter substrate-binding protein [Planctomycetota bacterium]
MPMIRALLLSILLACAAWAETVSVGAAISMREAMTQIAGAYAKKTGDKVEITFGSSGQLMGQIKAGAPIDAFISAADKQVDDLAAAGLVDETTRRIVAGNTLVLIVPADSGVSTGGFGDLSKPEVRRIAAGEPKTVPAGQYAEQVFRSFRVTAEIKEKLVYGTNVRQVLDYVERGEVTAGVVYKTDAMESGGKVRVVATAPTDSHDPIVYPAVLVKASSKREATIRFLDYLGGQKAREVFAAKGFTAPETAATRPSR